MEISQQYIKDTIRLSAEQNIVFRWVSNAELPFLYEDLKQLGLHGYGNTLSDVTACPGTDSCKLGITASRGLAAMLHEKFQNELYELGEKTGMKIKVSGCPNSCGQHHIADLGFFGSAQSKEGRIAPVFQMLLGGTTSGNAQSYGLAVGKISPHRVPEAIERVNRFYENFGEVDESFSQFVERVGKKKVKEELADLMTLPTYEDNPDFFTDVGEETAFKLSTEKGECAGVLLPRTEFLLEECDRNNAQAAIMLEESRSREAYHLAKSSMEKASIALLLTQGYEEFGDYVTADAFKSHFVETSIFFAKPAAYYLKLWTKILHRWMKPISAIPLNRRSCLSRKRMWSIAGLPKALMMLLPEAKMEVMNMSNQMPIGEHFTQIQAVLRKLNHLDTARLIREAYDIFGDKLIATTSCGISSGVLVHFLSELELPIRVVFVNTGFLFQETLDYFETLKANYRKLDFVEALPKLTKEDF